MVKACCCLIFLAIAHIVVPSYSVFLSGKKASEVLRIRKRENSLFEEFKAGNLERECTEESCDFEEVNEIFPNTDDALIFWNKYIDGDQCETNPCTNNATCQDLIGGYYCHCPQGRDGAQCQYVLKATNCSDNYGYCAHICKEIPSKNRRQCSCMNSYDLSDDGFSCIPREYGCGYLRTVNKRSRSQGMENSTPDPRIIGGKVMKKGSSPWQILLMDAGGHFKCGGVLIHRFWILTAAHCIDGGSRFKVRLGEHNRTVNEQTEDTIVISKVIIHPNFSRSRMDNDIALLELSVSAIFSDYILPVCLPTKRMAEDRLLIPGNKVLVTGWGAVDENDDTIRPTTLLFINIALVSQKKCQKMLGNTITYNMICAGDPSSRKDACKGDSGGPMVIVKSGTWFLIGLVSWGEGCGRFHKFGVYTKVSNYLDWIYSETGI